MSYVVSAGGTAIGSPSLTEAGYSLIEPTIEEEINSIPTFTFSLAADHPALSAVTTLRTIIKVYDDGLEIFRGRVMETTTDFYGTVEVYCEGTLGFLSDSIVPPFAYQGTAEALLEQLLEYHNGEMINSEGEEDTDREIQLGTVDSDTTLTITTTDALSVWDIILAYIIDEVGGYVLIRKNDDSGEYNLSYYEEIGTDEDTDHSVKYGVNLIDLEQYLTSSDVITCLIPYGVSIDEGETDDDTGEYTESDYETAGSPYQDETTLLQETDDDGNTTTITDMVVEWSGNKLSIAGCVPGDRNSGDYLYESGVGQDDEEENYMDYYDSYVDAISIQSKEGIELWGKIWGTVTFDEMTQTAGQNQTGLYSKGYYYLLDQINSALEITLTAVDMSLLDEDISAVRVGDVVQVRSTPHDFNKKMICTSIHTELRSPENDSITLGGTINSLTKTIAKSAK